jgi:hypothetical protein
MPPGGVRGAPRVNLAQADTSHLVHQLYVKVVTAGDPDAKSREITLQVLRYVHERLKLLTTMGIEIKVNKIRSQDLQNPKLVDAMKHRGITRLPALTTLNNVYLGFNEIHDIYERNIKEYAAFDRRGEKPVDDSPVQEDDLSKYYGDEMTFEKAEDDAQETGIGEGDDMMDSYRRMMERRESSESSRRRPGSSARPVQTVDTRRDRPPAPSARPDNIAPRAARRPPQAPQAPHAPQAPRAPHAPWGAREDPPDPDEVEFQATIDRLSRDIDDSVRDQAFSVTGGDSLDDDGGADIQDDLMERAYYANMSSSDM